MITWMTRASFLDTAEDLDTETLLQTSEEALELLEALLGLREQTREQGAAARMWVGYEPALAAYVCSLATVMSIRGLPTALALRAKQMMVSLQRSETVAYEPPPWLADTLVLRSHRSNLARRWPKQYGSTWKGVDKLWPYLVPSVDVDGGYEIAVSKVERAMLASGERSLPSDIKKELKL